MSEGGKFLPPRAFWSRPVDALLAELDTTPGGLTSERARERHIGHDDHLGLRRNSTISLLLRQFRSPLVLLLIASAVLSQALSQSVDSLIIVSIVVGSGLLGFVQERGAVRAIEALRQLVRVHVDVLRDGDVIELGVEQLVPGDVVVLKAGDIVPGDCVVLSANRLSVDESVLTGEAFPVHKAPGTVTAETPTARQSNSLFFGSHVASGSATAVVVAVGHDTHLGAITTEVARHHVPTAFERGVTAYGLLLVKATAVLVIAVLMLNLVLERGLAESILFSLALAVGLTPQMLPAIVTLSLSIGAKTLAQRKVIVKRLDSIEDFGSVDVLCSDKTGTITEGLVKFTGAVDYRGQDDAYVLQRAYWNAHLQVGHANPIDDAISAAVAHSMSLPSLIGELPFDFTRKLVSVVIRAENTTFLVCKGAVERVLERCSHVRIDSERRDILASRVDIDETFQRLSAQGLRVLGVAETTVDEGTSMESVREENLTFLGFICLNDPPKEGARSAIEAFRTLGIAIKIITGDNRFATRFTASAVGLETDSMMTGADIAALDDARLADRVESTDLFVEVDPLQKGRIIRALSSRGHTVGFLGDGINDAAALHAADVGISVDTGVDVAKETADLVLLDKSLSVISDGIVQGRRVFVNTLKYVYVTTSANFGNMVSLGLATVFLPFLPMLPLQILLLNFLSDVPGMTIATDSVDEERLGRPQQWNNLQVRQFMIVFGLISTFIDMMSFAILRWWFGADAPELRTGWFLVSVLTEVVAILCLRTARVAFRSRPGRLLVLSSIGTVLTSVIVVLAPIRTWFEFSTLPPRLLAILVLPLVTYVVFTEVSKRFSRRLFTGST